MGIEPPSPLEKNNRRDDRHARDLPDASRRRTESIPRIERHQKNHVGPEAISADLVARPRCERISPHSDDQENDLGCHCPRYGVPQPEAISCAAARIGWQIGSMRNPVQNPMAYYTEPDTNSPRLVLCTRAHLCTASFGFVLAQDSGGARENAVPQIYGGDDFGVGT